MGAFARLVCAECVLSHFLPLALHVLSDVSDLSDFSSKRVYLCLLSGLSSPPLLPVQWSRFVSSDFLINRHWSLVRDDFCENFKNDLSWLITLRGVKVRNSLRNWGYIDSSLCASCPRQETIDHCFLFCPRVYRVWTHFSPFLSLILGCAFICNPSFVFFFPLAFL